MASESAISSASEIQMDYMKLLVTQLQNQNPLEPLDNNEMASQLAQFSELSQLETMNSRFAEVLETTKRDYANSLLGKTVTFYTEDETTGELEQKEGSVDSIFNDPESGESLLGVTVTEGQEPQEYTLSLGAVILVEN
jgi:flagellar hook assembly protein FlgD